MIFQVPSHKIEKLKRAIRNVLESEWVPIKDIAQISAFLVAVTIAIGPIARLFTRQMYFAIACRRSWRDLIFVSEPLSQELKFWLQHIDAFNGYAIKTKFLLHQLFIVMRVILPSAVIPPLLGPI